MKKITRIWSYILRFLCSFFDMVMGIYPTFSNTISLLGVITDQEVILKCIQFVFSSHLKKVFWRVNGRRMIFGRYEFKLFTRETESLIERVENIKTIENNWKQFLSRFSGLAKFSTKNFQSMSYFWTSNWFSKSPKKNYLTSGALEDCGTSGTAAEVDGPTTFEEEVPFCWLLTGLGLFVATGIGGVSCTETDDRWSVATTGPEGPSKLLAPLKKKYFFFVGLSQKSKFLFSISETE